MVVFERKSRAARVIRVHSSVMHEILQDFRAPRRTFIALHNSKRDADGPGGTAHMLKAAMARWIQVGGARRERAAG